MTATRPIHFALWRRPTGGTEWQRFAEGSIRDCKRERERLRREKQWTLTILPKGQHPDPEHTPEHDPQIV